MAETRKVPVEFVVLVALLNAMVAMSIDTMLPAIGAMAAELGAAGPNSRQFIITVFFAGLMLGTLISGSSSDAIGRKPAIMIGLAFYAVGAIMCLFSVNFAMLLAGRFIQGFGAAAPRIVSIAMVRDGHSGAAMAKVMSFVMMVFMLVPILAPSVGQLVLFAASWRVIFLGFLAMAAIAAFWLWFRQEETLPRERRSPLSLEAFLTSAREVVRHPVTMGYTLAVGCVFGSFVCYLGTSQQIFAEQYGQGAYFAAWFGLFAIGIALAMMFNARLVMRFGMRALSKWALRAGIILSSAFLAVSLAFGGHPPLALLGFYFFGVFFCSGILFGNYNAMAMEPMGRIAGMAAAISGALSTLTAVVTGSAFGQLYAGTVTPVVAAFAALGLAAFLLTERAERLRT